MPDQTTPDLDARIRDLVHRAVADAPAPPEIGIISPRAHSARRSPWIAVTGGLAAAAAVVAALVLATRTGSDGVVDDPGATSSPVPVTTEQPGTTAPESRTTFPPATTLPPATTVPPVSLPPFGDESIVSAGLDGVHWFDLNRDVVVTDQPMAAALVYQAGPASFTVLTQKRSGFELESQPSDTTIMVWRSSTRQLAPLLADPDPEGFYRLHDVATVDGVPTLLFEVQPRQVSIESPPGRLFAMSLIDLVPVEVAEVGGWEAGTSRLHLADTGVIVGALHSEVTTTFASWSVGAVPPITAAQLGLDPAGYSDCSACPHTFTISADGSTVGWIENGLIELRNLSTGDARSGDAPAETNDAWSLDLSADGRLVIGHDQPSSFVELPDATLATPFEGGSAVALTGGWAVFGSGQIPEDPLSTYPGPAWKPAADLRSVLADEYPSADAAAEALQGTLAAQFTGDGGPRLRREQVDGRVDGVLIVWTNVPDDSTVEQYYFLELESADGGHVRVVDLQTATLGRAGTICGTPAVLCP